MMKTKLQHLLIAFFGLALFACDNSDKEFIEPVPDLSDGLNSSHSGEVIDEADICGEPYKVPLNYGGGTAGEVTIANDDENLYVHIYSEDGFQDIDDNVSLWVGTDMDELELNSFGIPLTSDSYQYLDDAEGTDYTFIVPLEDVMGYDETQCGNDIIYVVTQVAAIVSVDGNDAYVTGYGGSNLVDASFPWWFDSFVPQCCDDIPPPPVDEVCGEPYVIPLQYGGGIGGDVTVWNDESNLYVRVYSEDGFQDLEDNIRLWLGTDLDDLELNSFGIPLNASSYDYVQEASGTEHTFTVPLEDIRDYDETVCGQESVYVVTQAAIIIDSEGSEVFMNAYGGNTFVDTSFPWWYDSYTPQCCEDEPPVDEGCETAYAQYPVEGDFGFGYVFASSEDANPEGHFSLELTNNQWGWAGRITEDGSYDFNLWAAAGLNDTSKGTLVGTVTVDVSGDDVTVTYNIMDDYSMDELHIYVSNDTPETTAPGQYGYTMEFDDPQTTHMANFTVDGERDIWVIAHAVVCGDYPDDDEG